MGLWNPPAPQHFLPCVSLHILRAATCSLFVRAQGNKNSAPLAKTAFVLSASDPLVRKKRITTQQPLQLPKMFLSTGFPLQVLYTFLPSLNPKSLSLHPCLYNNPHFGIRIWKSRDENAFAQDHTFFSATSTYGKLLVRFGAGEIHRSQRKRDRPCGPCQSSAFPKEVPLDQVLKYKRMRRRDECAHGQK